MESPVNMAARLFVNKFREMNFYKSVEVLMQDEILKDFARTEMTVVVESIGEGVRVTAIHLRRGVADPICNVSRDHVDLCKGEELALELWRELRPKVQEILKLKA